MTVFKKIGFVFVYYLLASLLDQIFIMLFGNIFASFALTALSVCATSAALRKGQITKRNYLQEQRDEYSKSFKSKLKHIVSSFDFKAEAVIGVTVCLIFVAIPRVAIGACYAFMIIEANRLYGLLLIPMFIITDFLIWYIAYYKSFKKKKY